MPQTQYYRISDADIVGKITDDVPYIYSRGGWRVDNENILMDRLIGYDGDDIGSSDEMDNIEEISEAEAVKIISQ